MPWLSIILESHDFIVMRKCDGPLDNFWILLVTTEANHMVIKLGFSI